VIDCAERPDQLALGEFFVMRMKLNGLPYRSRNEIVELEPGRVIAWRTMPCGRILGLFFGGQTWRFGLAPRGGGCTVTHSWDPSKLVRSPLMTRIMRFEERNRRGMATSMERLQQLFR